MENPFFLSFPSRLPFKPLLSRSGSVERLGNGSENGGAYLATIYPPLSCTLGSVPQLLKRAQKSGKGGNPCFADSCQRSVRFGGLIECKKAGKGGQRKEARRKNERKGERKRRN